MYCRNCGHKVEEGDKFCSACGAKTVEEHDVATSGNESESFFDSSKPLFEPFDFNKIDLALGIDSKSELEQKQERGQEEPKPSTTEEFDWNIHTFPGTKVEKTEDIDFDWNMSADEPEPAPAEKPVVPDASEEPPVVKSQPDFLEQQAAPVAKEPSKPLAGLEEQSPHDAGDKAGEGQEQPEGMDKFFTFHKKNEEFQKLLDQEYEKIKSGNMLSDEMDSAAAASEKKFAERKPADPMDELFASEGVVKGYQPKPIESDVLERIEAAEAEKRAKEESARLVEEERIRARKEAEEKTRQETEERARKEAEQRARQEAEEKARKEAEEKAKQEAEAQARQEAEEKARKEAEEKARAEMEAKETEAARFRLQEDAKRAADAQAAEEAAQREKERMEAQTGTSAPIKDLETEEQRIQAEMEARLAEQATKIQEQIAKQEAEVARLQAEAAKAEAAKREAEAAKEKAFEEMQKVRQQQQGQVIEEAPVKTKAVNKAEILAGIATATEMVERDKAFAAAEAAKAKEEEESIQLPDFLGHLDEVEEEESEQQPIDLFEGLAAADAEQSHAGEEDKAEDDDILSLDELLTEEEPHEESESLALEQEGQKEGSVREMATPEEAKTLQPEQPEQEKVEHEEASIAAASEGERDNAPSADSKEQKSVEKADKKDKEADEDGEEKEKGRVGSIILKICLVILVILLALEVAGVVIKVALPDSNAAKFIDEQLNKVIQMVTGDDTEYRVLAAEEEIRTEPMQDKTELIKAEMGKNKDGNIGEIAYSADLKFDPEKEYENTDINLTQDLTDVTWHKDASDEQVYFDQAIVGTIIAYESQRMNLINYGDTSVMNLVQKGTDLYKELKKTEKSGDMQSMTLLQIGEIRQAGSSYFVWVSETIGGTETKNIYEMTPEGETMKLTASYEL